MKKIISKTLLLSALTPLMVSLTGHSFATTLAQVYQQALDNNDGFKSSLYTYQAAKEALPLAYSSLLPQVSLQYSYSSTYSNVPSNTYQETVNSLSLSQPIFNWSYLNNISVAKASIMYAYATFLNAKQSLIANTIDNYLSVIENQKILLIDEEYLTKLNGALKLKSTTKNTGSNSDESNQSQIQSIIDQQKIQIITDKQSLSQSVESLNSITHQYYTSLSGPLPLKKVQVLDSKNSWVAIAQKNNLSVVASQAALLSSQDQLRGARGVFLPTVSVSPSYSNQHTFVQSAAASASSGGPSSGGTPSSVQNASTTSVTLSASMPIFSGGSSWITMKEDKYSVEAAQRSLDNAIQAAVSTTKTDYVSVQSAISSFNASEKAVLSSQKSLNNAEKSYKEGVDNSFDLVSSYAALISAKKNVVQNLLGYFENMTQLKLQAGTLNDKDVDSLNRIFVQSAKIPALNFNTK